MRGLCAVRYAIALFLVLPCGAPVAAQQFTPHSAAALLDDSFPTEQACQHALNAARRDERVRQSEPVHGLSYSRLFEQGRCSSFHHKAGVAWRVRMHWKRRD